MSININTNITQSLINTEMLLKLDEKYGNLRNANTNQYISFSTTKDKDITKAVYSKSKTSENPISKNETGSDGGKSIIEVIKLSYKYTQTSPGSKTNINTRDSEVIVSIVLFSRDTRVISPDKFNTINVTNWTDTQAKDQDKSDSDKLTTCYTFLDIQNTTIEMFGNITVISFTCDKFSCASITEDGNSSNGGKYVIDHTASASSSKKSK